MESPDHSSPLPQNVEQAIDPRIAELIQHNAPFPRELRDEVYNVTYVGPYAKYRWRENKQVYTISLGLLHDYPKYPFTPQRF